jgi:hypothetical protein
MYSANRWHKRPSLHFSVSCLWNGDCAGTRALCKMVFEIKSVTHTQQNYLKKFNKQPLSDSNKRLATAFPRNWERLWSQEKWQTGCKWWDRQRRSNALVSWHIELTTLPPSVWADCLDVGALISHNPMGLRSLLQEWLYLLLLLLLIEVPLVVFKIFLV